MDECDFFCRDTTGNELAADIGSVIDGICAVEIGLIDEVGGLGDALLALHGMIEQKRRTTA